MKTKSLYWLIFSISMAVCCYFVYMYHLEEKSRNLAFDYSINCKQHRNAALIAQAPASAIKADSMVGDSTIIAKVNTRHSAKIKNELSENLLQRKALKDTASVKADEKVYSVKQQGSTKDSEPKLLELQAANNLLLTKNTMSELTDENKLNAQFSQEYSLLESNQYQKNELFLDSYQPIGFNINSAENSSNSSFSQLNPLSVNASSTMSNQQTLTTSELVAYNQIPITTPLASFEGKPMRANGTPAVEDPFAGGGGAENGNTYNDNNVLGSLPIGDGSSILFLLSFIFIAFKSYKLRLS